VHTWPDATHTVQDTAVLTIDRRLVGSVSAAEAVEGVREAIGDQSPFGVDVAAGPFMYPARLAPDHPLVTSFSAGVQRVREVRPVIVYSSASADAGLLNHAGIPCISYGPGAIQLAHTNDDDVSLRHVAEASRVLTNWARGPGADPGWASSPRSGSWRRRIAPTSRPSDGRFILGYGSGDTSVRVMGWKTSRIDTMRISIANMRILWRGETTSPHGQPIRLAGAPGRDIPVYVSATGPRMLSFTGEVGDGVIVLAGISEDAIRNATSRVAAGAAAAGRDAPKVATGLFCYVGDDRRDHLIQARPYAALYAIRHGDNLIADGLAVPEPGPITGIYPT
jgi:hypothetical protein